MNLSRVHPDPYARDEPPLEVDRRRIIHSSAFRRLQYKTQVFVARAGDHFRSRLTHTLEVAQLAGRIARRLGLSAELAEIVALAHDLGHPPFGHAGERALDACLRQATGGRERFEHNLHSLRVVEYLEHPYPEFRGLNLTQAVRDCLRTHTTRYDRPESSDPPPPEGLAVACADQLAYCLHDLQDALYAGLIEPRDLAELELWQRAYRGPDDPDAATCRRHLRPTVEAMLALLLDALHLPDAPAADASPVLLTEAARGWIEQLSGLLERRVYRDSSVVRMDSKARRIVTAVFEAYVAEPDLMPRRFAERVAEQGAARVAVDYIAGMTDRFCAAEHARLFDSRMEI